MFEFASPKMNFFGGKFTLPPILRTTESYEATQFIELSTRDSTLSTLSPPSTFSS